LRHLQNTICERDIPRTLSSKNLADESAPRKISRSKALNEFIDVVTELFDAGFASEGVAAGMLGAQ
jgi:hypothetical protein